MGPDTQIQEVQTTPAEANIDSILASVAESEKGTVGYDPENSPSGSVAQAEGPRPGEMWNNPAPETRVANHAQEATPAPEAPVVEAPAVEPEIAKTTDSVDMGDSIYAKRDEAFGEDVTMDTLTADALNEKRKTQPGISKSIPEFHARANEELEKGIDKADENFTETLARYKQERDELRERALQKKETLSTELMGVVNERKSEEDDLKHKQEAESKELADKYDGKIQEINQQLADLEQVLSEI
jgi:hypothetical protein